LPAASEIGVDVFQDAARGSGREAGEGEAGNDAVGFLKTVFFEIYIDIFGGVANHYQAVIIYVPQFIRQFFFDFKTKKCAIRG